MATQYDNIVYVDEAGDEDKLNVEFSREVNNVYSLAGELISSQEEDFITIKSPGDPTNVIHEIVNDDHKKRFPRHWNAYASQQAFGGTPLADWPELSDSQRVQFMAAGFRYVEHIAMAHQDAFNKIMGGTSWKAKAQAFLQKGKSEESATIKQQRAEIDELKAQMAQLLAKPGRDENGKFKAA